MKYFDLRMTDEQAKSEFRRLSKIHHNDKGGSDAVFVEIKQEYDDFIAIHRHWQEIGKYFTRPIIKKVVKVVHHRPTVPPPQINLSPDKVEQWIDAGEKAFNLASNFFSAINSINEK